MKEFWELLKTYMTPQTITTITAVLMFLVATLKLVSMVKTLNKQKAMTMENLKAVLLDALKSQNEEEINKAMNEIVKPIAKQVNEMTPVLQTFAKILALSQENTPTSRVAILELLEKTGKTDKELIVEAKQEINNQVITEENKKQETLEKLEAIENKPVE